MKDPDDALLYPGSMHTRVQPIAIRRIQEIRDGCGSCYRRVTSVTDEISEKWTLSKVDVCCNFQKLNLKLVCRDCAT